jgi:hypothetical protein
VMQPIRTPLKTELGLAAAKARGGRTRLAAAADMVPRKARLEVKGFVFMIGWDRDGQGSLEKARSSCKICPIPKARPAVPRSFRKRFAKLEGCS